MNDDDTPVIEWTLMILALVFWLAMIWWVAGCQRHKPLPARPVAMKPGSWADSVTGPPISDRPSRLSGPNESLEMHWPGGDVVCNDGEWWIHLEHPDVPCLPLHYTGGIVK